MLPPLLISPLFPYTTLFRSLPAPRLAARDLLARPRGTGQGAVASPPPSCFLQGMYSWDTDRKSTRLNSSHLGISYAVFCLKKKKKNDKNHHLAADPDRHVDQ